jgi:hypothetical protein
MAIAEKDLLPDDLQQGGETEEIQLATVVSAPASSDKRTVSKRKKQGDTTPAPAAPAASPAAAPAPARRGFKVPVYVYWMLLCVALLVGGFWLVLNPAIITENINQPYALLFGPALLVSGLALWLVVKFFTAIERGIRSAIVAFKAARARDESAQFFWMVIFVFLMVSVFASGEFFSKLEKDAIPLLGYATALVIDLVAVVCMRARLNAGRLRDKQGQALYLVGVVFCAAVSAFANVFTTLTTFDTHIHGLPDWMAAIAPWFGLVFPSLIVLLSMTADYALDQTSSKLDPESYKAVEGKRVKLLEYQRDLLKERVGYEEEIDDLAGQLRGRKERRVFFLVAWLFPLQMGGKELLKRVEALYQPQIVTLTEQNEALKTSLAGMEANAMNAYNGLLQFVQGLQYNLDSQRDTDNRLLVERIDNTAAGLRQEVLALAPATEVEALASDLRGLAPMVQVENLVEGLRQELRGLAPTSQVEALASDLRQEMRSAASPKVKINYTELARLLAPVLVKQQVLNEVNSEVADEVSDSNGGRVPGDTEEIAALNIKVLTSFNDDDETSFNEVGEEASEADKAAWLQQPTVTIKQAAALIDKEPKYVRTLRDRGTLKVSSRNNSLITTASLKAYLSKRSVKA